MGAKPLPRNGSSVSGIGRLLAVSTLLATRASATDSQVIASEASRSIPTAPSHWTASAEGRNPTANATAVTMARPITVCSMAPSTCPVSTEAREIAMVRKRSMMPLVMSMATAIAVPWAVAAIDISRIPGTR